MSRRRWSTYWHDYIVPGVEAELVLAIGRGNAWGCENLLGDECGDDCNEAGFENHDCEDWLDD